ncbi:hypothetical protein ABZP36_009397 [Zizania latifolia]
MSPRKKVRKAPRATGVDHIRALPDAVLHHVLSFLPSQGAMRTCALSRRWRHLWKSAVALRIGDCGAHEHGLGTVRDAHGFVDHLLLLRDGAPLDACVLRFVVFDDNNTCTETSSLNLWIRHALLRKVRFLHVDIRKDGGFTDLNIELQRKLPSNGRSSAISGHLETVDIKCIASSLHRILLPKHGDMMTTDASTNGLDPNQIMHYATYQTRMAPKDGFAGAMGTFDYYDFPNTKNGSAIGAQIWVQTDQTIAIVSGWETDGDRSTGCNNLDCTGFVPVNGAPITPGDILDHSSGQTKISLKIFKHGVELPYPTVEILVLQWAMGNGQKKAQPLYKMYSSLTKMGKAIFHLGLLVFMP